ncbi:MAG: FecR family protein, partial [Telluria sp.]
MKNQRLKRTAIKALLSAALLGFASLSWAQVVGTVTHLSGPLVAKKANGTVKVLAVKSEVENGDTLVSEKNTYAQIKFVDNGQITLRPGTVFKIENYSYNADKPDGDAEHLELIKGGLRSVTGLLGKRNKEKFALKTPSATIGIRGTTFIATYVPPSRPTSNDMRINPNPSPLSEAVQGKLPSGAPGTGTIDRSPDGGGNLTVSGKLPTAGGSTPGTPTPTGSTGTTQQGMAAQLAPLLNGGSAPPVTPPAPPGSGSVGLGQLPAPVGPSGPPSLAPGLHLQVTDGAIVVTNAGGSLGFQAGQFGYVPSVNQPPVIVPSNPGIQ